MAEFEELSSKIINAAIQVHKTLGPGFLEIVYEKALRIELALREIAFESQKRVEIYYEGIDVGTHYLDLLVENEIVVELKAVRALEYIHFAQTRAYLRAVNCRVGLLLNFNSTTLVIKRIVNGWGQKEESK